MAGAYQPGLASSRQAQAVQLGMFVCLAQAGAAWWCDGVCLPGPSVRFPQLPSTTTLGSCLFACTAHTWIQAIFHSVLTAHIVGVQTK
jgi:hypothetical protein